MKPPHYPNPGIHFKAIVASLLASVFLCFSVPSMAWDATAHRISAYLTWDRLSDSTRQELSQVLSAHPRFDADFMEAMPATVRHGSTPGQQRWLFGRAAVWPDVARGLPDDIRERYNRPDWHWIDGAVVRDHATEQGNIYLEVPRQPDIDGHRHRADNVLTALERAHRRLLAPDTGPADRAVALSWFLHLAGDIHQPLHSGALFAPGPLENGDRGGNLIRVSPGHEGGNLHALWDRALRNNDREALLMALKQQRDSMHPAPDASWAPTGWLAESRGLLHDQVVYPRSLRTAILQSIERNGRVATLDPSTTYIATMREIAQVRLIHAAERMAAVLSELEIPQ
ncbi:MAG: S1/P1 nuclease [Pseudomonadota bacterium]